MIKHTDNTPSLFSSLCDMLNQSHPLYQLADKIDWAKFDKSFSPLYCQSNGRPCKPVRLICGLLIVKHLRNLSDEPDVQCIAKGKEHRKYEFGNKVSITCSATGIILGAMSFRNEYDGHTIEPSLAQVERLTGRKIKVLAGDRGYRGKKEVNGTKIMIPDVPKKSDSRYHRLKRHKLFRKRAGIEPVIGHLKSDFRLVRNFYKGVAGYAAKDAVYYNHYTTLRGIIEKDNPTIYDYDVPKRLKELYRTRNFGPYTQDGEVPVCFIATNHTTGGNSGSPVLDGEGNLIGLNFDRAWEGVMSDMQYSPEICRNIAVDIRYVLFIIDKFAGARHLIEEMVLVP